MLQALFSSSVKHKGFIFKVRLASQKKGYMITLLGHQMKQHQNFEGSINPATSRLFKSFFVTRKRFPSRSSIQNHSNIQESSAPRHSQHNMQNICFPYTMVQYKIHTFRLLLGVENKLINMLSSKVKPMSVSPHPGIVFVDVMTSS